MKNKPHHPPRKITGIIAILFTAVLLTMTVSCGKKESTCTRAYKTLETQFKDLKASITGGQTSADRAVMWQGVATAMVVISVFALIGGAALGSRARRETSAFQTQPVDNNPEGSNDEITL